MEVNENLRMRQLLKVLAVSDVVVYKTRAERLHSGKTINKNHIRFYVPMVHFYQTALFVHPNIACLRAKVQYD